jgi:hypothetical protein
MVPSGEKSMRNATGGEAPQSRLIAKHTRRGVCVRRVGRLPQEPARTAFLT